MKILSIYAVYKGCSPTVLNLLIVVYLRCVTDSLIFCCVVSADPGHRAGGPTHAGGLWCHRGCARWCHAPADFGGAATPPDPPGVASLASLYPNLIQSAPAGDTSVSFLQGTKGLSCFVAVHSNSQLS